ncbi:MAG: MBL fold metallo-hydrolase, partial [Clostridia bacterium]|nr:MBL fold metallo-hydrolase [Clostridia bacterium]
IKIEPRNFGSNSYILTSDGKFAVVIDPSSAEICAELEKRSLECKYVLLTHGHFDHVGGCAALQSNGAEIWCGEPEEPLIFSKEYLSIFGGVQVPPFKVTRTLKHGESFNLCGMNFLAILTAGHTKGSMCFISEDKIFTGDTLFYRSVGRCDLPTGSFTELKASLKKLSSLVGEYKIYGGHGADTTLSAEKKFNSYLTED